MGHDYHLQRVRLSTAHAFPVPVGELADRDLIKDSVDRVHSVLSKLPGVGLNGDQLAWLTPDGGSLTFYIGDDGGILVDTHAGLDFVLQVQKFLISDHPDWVILDPQTGLIHDESSLRKQHAERQRMADEMRRKLGLQR